MSELLKTTFNELKKIMKKDLGRKMVESSAFKSLEAWWDDCELKFKVRKKSFNLNSNRLVKRKCSFLEQEFFRSSMCCTYGIFSMSSTNIFFLNENLK